MPISKTNSAEQPGKRRILLVDDHPVMREGLAKCLNHEDDLTVCGEAKSAAEALRVVGECQPDVVVLDLALGDGHGLEVVKDIRAHGSPVPILVYTMHEESIYALRVLQVGAQGYLMKHEPTDRLLQGIRTVLKGGYAVSPRIATQFLRASIHHPGKNAGNPADLLGNRELEVFELIGNGVGTRQIALRLGRSVKTIETYRARIKEKLQLKSATALTREAVRWIESQRPVPTS